MCVLQIYDYVLIYHLLVLYIAMIYHYINLSLSLAIPPSLSLSHTQ